MIAALHEAGAGLLPGSDSPQIFNVPGFAIHRELDRMLDRFRRDDPLPGL